MVKDSMYNVEMFVDQILDLIQDGVYITDYTGKTLKANKAYEKHSGNKKEEMVGNNVKDLVREGIIDIALNSEVVRTGKAIKNIVQRNRNGKKVLLSAFPVFDQFGKVALVTTFVEDITLLSELKKKIDKQRLIIDQYHNQENKCLLHHQYTFQNEKMIGIAHLIDKISDTDTTILILGETGVGKDILARQIHEKSVRSDKPYFKVDCASIPENLIESELFGYAPGAFSGANTKGKLGFFEIADKGTLFLDEIGELSMPMQSRLLRALQDHEIMSVGATKVKKIDVRIISATNRNLKSAVEKGEFRKDLYYRLHGTALHLPPLREMATDIVPLAKYFLEKFNRKYEKKIKFSEEVEEYFRKYAWPGNIREMENVIHSLVIIRDTGLIQIQDLPNHNYQSDTNDTSNILAHFNINTKNKSLNEIMSDIEKELIRRELDQYGSISKVADLYKVDRTTIFRKAKKYSLL